MKISLSSVFRKYQTLVMLLVFAIFQAVILGMAFVVGYIVRDLPVAGPLYSGSKFQILSESIIILEENALNPLPDSKRLEYGMIRGMLAELNDPFTVLVEPPQHELQTNQLEGRFGGIGVRIERDAEKNVILYPLPDSPALEAGIQEGDRLFSVESLNITPVISDAEIQAAVRGPVGEKVKVMVGHAPLYNPIELSIDRAEVALPSITWNLSPYKASVGVIHMRVIADTTPDEVKKAIVDLQQRGASSFIIDVRDNGGGLVDAGVNTARLFLKNGIIIQQQYRGKEVKTYSVTEPGPFTDFPLVLLVNKGTASAAEIFTGALQGQQRAKVVGSPTYGKDTIQLVFKLSDGSSLHVTAARWWVPGLPSDIGENGIKPDVNVDSSDPNMAMQTAVETVMK